MTLSAAVILAAVSAVGLAMIAFGWRARRAAAALALSDAAAAAATAVDVPDVSDVIAQRVEALLQDHERRLTDAFSHVREDLSGLKSDVEWLAGERMIEQAIALAQTGSGVDEIGQELGLSRDQAATIALFRKH